MGGRGRGGAGYDGGRPGSAQSGRSGSSGPGGPGGSGRGGGRGPGGPPAARGSAAPSSGHGSYATGRGGVSEADALRQITYLFKGLVVNTTPKDVDGVTARPGYGTVGQKVKVLANHFKLADVSNNLTMQQYDVAIEKIKRERPPGQAGGSSDRPARPPRPEPEGPPPMPDRNTCHTILNKLATTERWPQGRWAYDGQKQLWTVTNYLPAHQAEWTVMLRDRPDQQPQDQPRWKVTIQPTATLPVGKEMLDYWNKQAPEVPRNSMQGLDVALRQGATMDPANVLLGRGVYTNQDTRALGFGLDMKRGYIQSLNLVESGLTLSLDDSVIAVPKQEDLLLLMADVLVVKPTELSSRALTDQQLQQLNKYLGRNSVRITITHRSHGLLRHSLRSFTLKPARQCMFEDKSSKKQMSVEQYFTTKYKLKLKYPMLPCAEVGSRTKPEWIPVEFCRVLPDLGKRNLTGDQTTAILREAAVRPHIRSEKIMNHLLNRAKLHVDRFAAEFGLKFVVNPKEQGPVMMSVMGRILPSPFIKYGSGTMSTGDKGDWNMANKPFISPVVLKSFAVVCYVPADRVDHGPMPHLLSTLKSALEEKGTQVQLADWPPVVYRTRDISDEDAMIQAVQQATKKLGLPPQILFIIQERENQVYSEVKRIADTRLGIMTQCLVYANLQLERKPEGIGRKLAGVALKVNMKLGGDCWHLAGGLQTWCPATAKLGPQGTNAKVMFMGADVTHAAALPGQKKSNVSEEQQKLRPDQPSIAAVVASMNAECTKFATRITSQAPLTEFITAMEQSAFELLKMWQQSCLKATGKAMLPDVIIMYRDGVSEGQFRPVLQAERDAIKRACEKFKSGQVSYKPKITFITVQKRHQTRLFPGEPEASDAVLGGRDPSNNLRPGIVVDRDIVHPKEFDFYLNSHAGLQGTNKAAKYSVLSDEVGFTADSMQVLTHWLCHTFCRCTRSVSYCPPAYYAHHAAFRARCWLRKVDKADTSSQASGGSGSRGPAWAWEFHNAHPNIADRMYFI